MRSFPARWALLALLALSLAAFAVELDTITDPLMKVTNIENDPAGNAESVTDPELHVTQYGRDAQNRLIEVIDAASGHTKYVYDLKGNLKSLTDARSKTTQFEYNNRDLVRKITNSLGQARTFTYDLSGKLRFADDAKGQQIEFIYDNADQLTTKILRNASHVVTDTASFTYDDFGTVETASDGDSSLVFTPDPLGRLTSAVTGGTLPATTVSYTYDKNGNLKSMTDPQGSMTAYDYDELDRLLTLSSHLGVFTFGSDDAGRRESLGYPNGVSAHYDYDAGNRLTALHLVNSSMTLLSKYDYTYDDAGNRGTRTTLDGVTNYGYDALDRLTGAVGPDPANPLLTLTESYGYDAVGNRTGSHLAAGQVYDNANRLLEDSNFTYTYDLNGNLASMQDKSTSALTTYDWDVENRLVAVHAPTETVTFKYDALGRRIEMTGTTTTRYIYDLEAIIEERDGSNVLKARYVHGPETDETLARRDVTAGQTAFLHADGLGSIADMTVAGGGFNPAHRYDSYGNLFVGAGSSGHAFTGREWDGETGLHFYRARYYDPKNGRFLSEDPVDYQNGISLYAYVMNRPTILVDPSGMVACAPDCPPDVQQGKRDLCNYANTIKNANIRQCIEKKCREPGNISCNQADPDCRGGDVGQTKTTTSMVLCTGNPMPPGACWKRVIAHEMWVHQCRPGGPAEPNPKVHQRKRQIIKKVVSCP